MYPSLFASSPEPYFLKKSAGSERIRIIAAASTETPTRVESLDTSISLTVVSISVLNDTQTMKIPTATSALGLQDFNTSEKSSSFSFGVRKPIRVTARVTATIIATSADVMFAAMNLRSPFIPIFFDGKGL